MIKHLNSDYVTKSEVNFIMNGSVVFVINGSAPRLIQRLKAVMPVIEPDLSNKSKAKIKALLESYSDSVYPIIIDYQEFWDPLFLMQLADTRKGPVIVLKDLLKIKSQTQCQLNREHHSQKPSAFTTRKISL